MPSRVQHGGIQGGKVIASTTVLAAPGSSFSPAILPIQALLAAALLGAALAQARATGDLTAGGAAAALAATPAAQATASGSLSTGIPLAAAPAAQATANAAFASTAAALAATPVSLATATAALSTGIPLGVTAQAAATGTAALTTQIKLATAPAAQATATAALTSGIKLATAATAQASAVGALSTGIQLAATPAAQATSGGALTTAIRLAAAPAAQATASAAFATTAAALASAPAAQAAATGALTAQIRLVAAPTAQATATAALTTGIVSIALAATPSVQATAGGNLSAGPIAFPTLPGLMFPVHKSPVFSTTIKTSVSGKETRIANYSTPVWNIGLSFEFLRDQDALPEFKTLLGFFVNRQGAYKSFLFIDPDDHTAFNEVIGTGDGVTHSFQLARTLGGLAEPICNVDTTSLIIAPLMWAPDASTPMWTTDASLMWIDAVVATSTDYTLSATGVLAFTVAPAIGKIVVWNGNYYYRCRFVSDILDLSKFADKLWELKKCDLKGSLGLKV